MKYYIAVNTVSLKYFNSMGRNLQKNFSGGPARQFSG